MGSIYAHKPSGSEQFFENRMVLIPHLELSVPENPFNCLDTKEKPVIQKGSIPCTLRMHSESVKVQLNVVRGGRADIKRI